ncbi:ureidoglycolate lyase [Kordiimonas laminariae]|uniref:ureidoglycolate lyase n=1 Tax=Kordiimonas laminariae TaxID=2917717 RepID=UPI001FF13B7B|nr:ureidoglycolate lyase [Kordiimonas laminariae]MCK0070810.1 ureidoglycolate lyase [Kordiimonas laminariae]
MRTIKAEPLTAEAFAPFGDVIEASAGAEQFSINYGNTTRFHNLADVNVSAEEGSVCVNIFRTKPLPQPIIVKLMEYHPLSSQAFIPMGDQPYLVVVAEKGEFKAEKLRVFLASADQGVNYHAGTWHHFSLALNSQSDFLVIDRKGKGDNCVEHELTHDEQVTISL